MHRRPNLTDPYLKLNRAKKHLDDLRSEIARIREEDDPIRIVGHDDPEKGLHHIQFEVKEHFDEASVICGDFLSCTRASLDQLVFSLASLTIPYPEGTQFPILDKNPLLDRSVVGNWERWTKGVHTEALEIIKDLQPYAAGNPAAVSSHLLWQLHKLSIIDKHRHVAGNFATETIVNFPMLTDADARHLTFDSDNGVCTVPIALKHKMTFDPVGSFDVMFGDAKEGVSVNLMRLRNIYNFVVESVMPRFTRFFQ